MSKRDFANVVFIFGLIIFINNICLAQICDSNREPSTPDARFVINAGAEFGTVTDIKTGLMWKQCVEGQFGSECTGSPITYSWPNAMEYAKNNYFAGYDDWRLPNRDELSTLIETACYSPAINLNVFPNSASDFIWSSSKYITRRYYFAWGVEFSDGGKKTDFMVSRNKFRLVRNIAL